AQALVEMIRKWDLGQGCQIEAKGVQLQFVFASGSFGVRGFVFHHGFESKPVWCSGSSWSGVRSIRERINFLIARSRIHPRIAANTSANAICSTVCSNQPAVKYPIKIEYAAHRADEIKSSPINLITGMRVAPAMKFTATRPPGMCRAVITTIAPEYFRVCLTPPMARTTERVRIQRKRVTPMERPNQ